MTRIGSRLLRPQLGLAAILAIFLAVTVSYGLLNPLGEAPDETAHMDLIRFIGRTGHLPRTPDERNEAGYKSAWPMLYHVLIGTATGWIDTSAGPHLKSSNASSRRLLIDDGLSPFAVIHTDDEAAPYQGVVLLWHMARLASTLLSAGTLLAVYFVVRALLPDAHWPALAAVACLAAIPEFQLMAAAVNDDNLLGLLCALFTLSLVKAWQQPAGRAAYAGMGLALGLALTTKYSVGLLPLLVVLLLVAGLRSGRLQGRAAAGRFALFAAVLAVAAAWWFGYVEWYFNRIAQLGVWAGLLKPVLGDAVDVSTQEVATALTGGAVVTWAGSAVSQGTLGDWAMALFQSFWLAPERLSPMAGTALCLVWLGVSLLAVAGLVYARARRLPLPWPMLGWLALQVLLLIPFPLLRFYLTRNPNEAGQGRHILFPAAAALAALFSAGASAWFSPARRRWAWSGLALLLLTISLASFFGFTLPSFPARLPVRTSAGAPQDVPNPVHVALGQAIELIGYQVDAINPSGALPVTLVWRCRATTDQEQRVELSLVDEDGAIDSRWSGYPAGGRYPIRAWEPGDVVRDQVWLPLTGLQPGTYHLKLQLQPPDEAAAPEGWELPAISIDRAVAAPQSRRPFIVWQDGSPAGGLPVFRFRSTIAVSLLPPAAAPPVLIGPDGAGRSPQAQAGNMVSFIVGADWVSGEYRLRLGSAAAGPAEPPVLQVQVRPRRFQPPALSALVQANFGGDVMLLGYTLPERRVQPGGSLPITVYWQALRTLERHMIVFNHLLHTGDLRQWGGRDRVPQDFYSTLLWAPGEVVQDDYVVPVDPAAPAGIYRLDIGLYVEAAGQAHSLPLMRDGAALDATSVTITPIKVGGPPPGATVLNPAPQHPRGDNLNGQVALVGYDLDQQPDRLTLTLYWRCQARLATDYTTFVHVQPIAGLAGNAVAGMDRPPANGAYPSSLWEPGEVIRDTLQVPLSLQLPAGEYDVVAGLYELATGQRLPVEGSTDGSITLTRLAR